MKDKGDGANATKVEREIERWQVAGKCHFCGVCTGSGFGCVQTGVLHTTASSLPLAGLESRGPDRALTLHLASRCLCFVLYNRAHRLMSGLIEAAGTAASDGSNLNYGFPSRPPDSRKGVAASSSCAFHFRGSSPSSSLPEKGLALPVQFWLSKLALVVRYVQSCPCQGPIVGHSESVERSTRSVLGQLFPWDHRAFW